MSESTPTSAAAIDRENPWPGLASFTEDSRAFFFGREKETEELVRLIRRSTLTVLFGQSGLGKSSLLQAGAFPLLREADFLPLYLRLDHTPPADQSEPRRILGEGGSLSDQVKAALVDAFKSVGADAPAPRADESLWEYFHRKDIDIWSAKNRLLTPVLAFDQFEEIFTLGRADETRRERGHAFLTELADLVENRAPATVRARFDSGELDIARYNFDKPSCQVVLSLREDFLPDLEGLKTEMRSIMHSRMRVRRLNGTQALEIVTKPAPHLIAEGVAERVVEFVAGARGGSTERLAELEVEPALLSVICRELNERRRALGQSQITADLVSGNRREILTNFYERSVADLPEAMRAFVEDHLLTKSGFRDNLALETALEFPGVTRPLIDTLVSRRLLRIEDRLGVQRVELTHDVLAEVIRASRDTRQQRLVLEESQQREYAQRRRARRLRWALACAVAAVFVVGIGAVIGVRAQRVAAQRAQRLASQQASRTDITLAARFFEEGRTADGLAYLVRAARKDPENHLLAPRLITTLVGRSFYLPDGAPLLLPSPTTPPSLETFGARFSSDGRRVFAIGEDNVLRAIEVESWRIEYEFRLEKKVRNWALAESNPEVVAVFLEDNSLLVCDASTGRPRLPPIRPPANAERGEHLPGLSPDGRWVVAGTSDTLWMWDAGTGALRATLIDKPFAYPYYSFSPDSRRIATHVGENRIQVWSVPDGAPVGSPIPDPKHGLFYEATFSPDGRRLLGRYEKGVQIYDIATGAKVGAFAESVASGEGTLFTPDGGRYIAASYKGEAMVVDSATGKPVFPSLKHGGAVYFPQLSRDGRILATCCVDGFFRLWDMETGRLLAEPTLQQNRLLPAVLSPDGSKVVLFSSQGAAYRLRVGRRAGQPLVLPGNNDAVPLASFMAKPPARLLWLMRDRARVIDVASGRDVSGGFVLPERLVTSERRPLGSQNKSPFNDPMIAEGQTIVGPTEGDQWHAWVLGASGVTADVTLDDVSAGDPRFLISPMGDLAAVSGLGSDRNSAGIWNLRTGRKMAVIKANSPTATFPSYPGRFSPDGTRVAMRTSDGAVIICDVATGRELCEIRLRRYGVHGLNFTPDGKNLITGDGWGGLHLWETNLARHLRSAQPHRDSAHATEFSPDGRSFVSLGSDGVAQVWDLATFTPRGLPMSSRSSVRSAAFSPDGTRLATVSRDGTARLWDVPTGQALTDPMLHGEVEVGKVGFSPDGRFIFTRTRSGAEATWIWPVPPASGGAPAPEWLLRLATICASKRVTDNGEFVSAVDEVAKIDEIRHELAALPDNAQYVEWGRWFLSDSPTRSIAPGFTITPAEARKLAEDMKREQTDSAETVQPTAIPPAPSPP